MSLVPLPSCVFNPTCPIGISQEMPPAQDTQSWFYCLHPEVGPEPGPPGWWAGLEGGEGTLRERGGRRREVEETAFLPGRCPQPLQAGLTTLRGHVATGPVH